MPLSKDELPVESEDSPARFQSREPIFRAGEALLHLGW